MLSQRWNTVNLNFLLSKYFYGGTTPRKLKTRNNFCKLWKLTFSTLSLKTGSLIQEGCSPPLYFCLQLLKWTMKSRRLLEPRTEMGALQAVRCIMPLLFTLLNFDSCLPNLSIDVVVTNTAKVFWTPSVNSLRVREWKCVLWKKLWVPLINANYLTWKLLARTQKIFMSYDRLLASTTCTSSTLKPSIYLLMV